MTTLALNNVRPYGEDATNLLINVTRGVIEAIGDNRFDDADEVIDCGGNVLLPGLVDMHVHLREPGREEAETIETGSRAAALGGFTAIVAMPNTEPAQDSLAVIEFVRAQARRAALCDVHPAGCITINREGTALAPLGLVPPAGG